MNVALADFAKEKYCESKADLFAMFLQRGLLLIADKSYLGMITLPSWLFLAAFGSLRRNILQSCNIESMLHMGRGIFGVDWGSVAFIIRKSVSEQAAGKYFRLHKRNFQHIHYQDIGRLFLNAKGNPNYRFDFDTYRTQ